MSASICINGTLSPYVPSPTNPWDRKRALHVYRRLGFGADYDQITAALQQNPTDLIDQLVDEALAMPLSDPPEWAAWTLVDFGDLDQMFLKFNEWRDTLVKDLLTDGLREKLTLFWHNHFVTQVQGYIFAPYGYEYRKTLQTFALGDFKAFVSAIGKTKAMLAYLNGLENTKFTPNENYARELYELFTMGRDIGYTQDDITETARALAGWTVLNYNTGQGTVIYRPDWADTGEKTIFGQTGNWGYDDVINLIFSERQMEVAQFIMGKLYKFFVSQDLDQPIVNELAQDFINENFMLAPVLRKLLKSEHFFEEAVVGVQVKSPIELQLGFRNEIGLTMDELNTFSKLGSDILGQFILSPPDVAGWPGHHQWIDSTTFTLRWQVADFYILYGFENTPELLRTFAKKVSGNSKDPDFISQQIIDHFIPRGLQQPNEYLRMSIIFRGNIPINYYQDGSWNLDWDEAPAQVAFLIYNLARLPEFQLI